MSTNNNSNLVNNYVFGKIDCNFSKICTKIKKFFSNFRKDSPEHSRKSNSREFMWAK